MADLRAKITRRLEEILATANIDVVSTKSIRLGLEKELRHSLREHKRFIAQECQRIIQAGDNSDSSLSEPVNLLPSSKAPPPLKIPPVKPGKCTTTSKSGQKIENKEPVKSATGKGGLPLIVQTSLPLIMGAKKAGIDLLMQVEGTDLDLTDDVGAIGRFSASKTGLAFDVKGQRYAGEIFPTSTVFIMTVSATEAKVDTIFDSFCQLSHHRNIVNEIRGELVEGDLSSRELNCSFAADEDVNYVARGGSHSSNSNSKKKKRGHDEADDDDSEATDNGSKKPTVKKRRRTAAAVKTSTKKRLVKTTSTAPAKSTKTAAAASTPSKTPSNKAATRSRTPPSKGPKKAAAKVAGKKVVTPRSRRATAPATGARAALAKQSRAARRKVVAKAETPEPRKQNASTARLKLGTTAAMTPSKSKGKASSKSKGKASSKASTLLDNWLDDDEEEDSVEEDDEDSDWQ